MLAQVVTNTQAHDVLTRVLESAGGLKIPLGAGLVDWLDALPYVHSAVLIAAGLVYLIWGYRVFKGLVILNAAVVGALLAVAAGLAGLAAYAPLWVLALIGAAALAALAWPLLHLAVAAMGALAGGAMGLAVWQAVCATLGREDLLPYAWAGGAAGAVALGALAFVLFRPTIIIFTALQGAAMLTAGALSLLLAVEQVRKPLAAALTGNPHLMPAIIGLAALAGVVIQLAHPPKPAGPIAPDAKRRE